MPETLISAEQLQTKTFEKTVSVAGVDISSSMTGEDIIGEITGSLIDPDGTKNSAVTQAFEQVVTENPTDGDFCLLGSLTGNVLNAQGLYDAAANAFELAFGEEVLLWNNKAIYSTNLIAALDNYINFGENNQEWLSNKKLSVAEAVTWVYKFRNHISGHSISADNLDQALTSGSRLLQLIK